MLATGVASKVRKQRLQLLAQQQQLPQIQRNICIAAAVNKRDSAMIVAHDAFAASVKAALTARKDGLVSVWTNGNKDAKCSLDQIQNRHEECS